MKFMNWDTMMAPYRENQDMRVKLLTLLTPALPEEPEYKVLDDVVEHYLRYVGEVIMDHPHGFTVRKILKHGEHIPREG